jgi:SagB-type dehydrogenase family enzyme
MKILVTVLFFSIGTLPLRAQDIILPKHPVKLNVDIIKAFEQRQTIRNYTDQKLSNDDIATILWAANGINRQDGKRTAPAAHGKQYINIYVADNEGNYFYDAINNRLVLRNKERSISRLSGQRHVSQSSHVIIITTDINRVPGLMSNRETKLKWANVTAGTIAQNIYLICAAKGIGTCLVGGINAKNITQVLGLSNNEEPILVMPLGYPKE